MSGWGWRPSIIRPVRRPEERGAVLIVAAVGVVVAVISASLAIDLGSLASDKRTDQKVADLAALDAVRDLSTYAARADSSARRNFFWGNPDPDPPLTAPRDPRYILTAVRGDVTAVGSACGSKVTPNADGTAVEVVVSSPRKPYFPLVNQTERTVKACAVASASALAGFMIGSSLVTLDTARAGLLNSFLGGILKGSALSLSLVSWQGLATGKVTLTALKTQLAAMGFSVGTVSQLLATNLTLDQFLRATANALTAQGDVANATVLNNLRASITNTTQFNLGQFMTVAQGADNTALASSLNVFQLLTAAAEVANGSSFISVPNAGIAVPGVLSTKLNLQVIQPPKFYYGPVGGSVSTAQITLTVTPSLNLNLNLGVATAVVTGDFPVKMTGAGATGTLKAATCGSPSQIVVTVDPTAFSGSATASLNARVSTLLGPIADVAIPTTEVVPSTDGGSTDLTFSFPTEFPPPDGTLTSKHAGSQPIGLNSLTQVTAGAPVVTLLGLLPLPLPVGSVVSAVLAALPPVLADVDNLVLTPLLQALGLDVGSADVTAEALTCASPALIG